MDEQESEGRRAVGSGQWAIVAGVGWDIQAALCVWAVGRAGAWAWMGRSMGMDMDMDMGSDDPCRLLSLALSLSQHCTRQGQRETVAPKTC